MGLRVVAPCVLISIGAAFAEDSQTDAANTPQVIQSQNAAASGTYSRGAISAEDAPPPIAAEPSIAPEPRHTALKGLFDINSPATALANESPSPIAPGPPIAPQHVAVSVSVIPWVIERFMQTAPLRLSVSTRAVFDFARRGTQVGTDS